MKVSDKNERQTCSERVNMALFLPGAGGGLSGHEEGVDRREG